MMSEDMVQAAKAQEMAGPASADVDYSCLEDEEDETPSTDLDPATFRAFVEEAVKEMHVVEKLVTPQAEGAAPATNKTGARFGYNAYVGQMPRIMVTPKVPYNIVHCSPAISEVLGFHEREMEGRSLNIAQGPMTNVALLTAKIAEAAGGSTSEHAFILYTNKGEDRVVTIEFEPEVNLSGEASDKVILTVDHGDWVPKKIADADDGRAKVTVKADKPWNVLQTSPSFNDMYGLKEEMILGRTLNVVFGPRTDANMFRQLLIHAKSARTQHVDMWTCRPSDMSHVFVSVSIFPVLDKGEITHFMVVFKRDEMAGSPQYASPRRQRPGSSPLSAAAGRMTLSE
uniref:PAS domain-containing protein n=2 Tax=Hemiselmis andersenii TaxID=464988 RepID=A0A6U4RUD8_HEMAN|mmetsp:Transcript_1612/g.3869  ORF Transcript_1612/g.3869 Transcript_1612/m.3869 type:complete len:342 (+) Transcript_1612:117-1142(+)